MEKKHNKEPSGKHPGGRPNIYDAKDIAKWLDNYVEGNDDPYINEFCLERVISQDTIYRLAKESKELSEAIKRCHLKQELRTVKKAENGEINTTFAIFKLKQKCYGWSDKQEIESVNLNMNAELSEEEADRIIKQFGSSND